PERGEPRLASSDAGGAERDPSPDQPHRADQVARKLELAHSRPRQHDSLEQVVKDDRQKDKTRHDRNDLGQTHHVGLERPANGSHSAHATRPFTALSSRPGWSFPRGPGWRAAGGASRAAA